MVPKEKAIAKTETKELKPEESQDEQKPQQPSGHATAPSKESKRRRHD
jgi:hypothetical protein